MAWARFTLSAATVAWSEATELGPLASSACKAGLRLTEVATGAEAQGVVCLLEGLGVLLLSRGQVALVASRPPAVLLHGGSQVALVGLDGLLVLLLGGRQAGLVGLEGLLVLLHRRGHGGVVRLDGLLVLLQGGVQAALVRLDRLLVLLRVVASCPGRS